jgi:hypothetical protein
VQLVEQTPAVGSASALKTLSMSKKRPSVPVSILTSCGLAQPLPVSTQRLQAHQEDRPLGAAMVHEFHRFLPALVLEEDDA